MCIVTGPRIELAITLINRMKGLLEEKIKFDSKETVVELNRVKIEAFPSHHLDAMRGLSNVSFILLDEADFFTRTAARYEERLQKDILQNPILIL